jgi:hypothetical protein
LPCHIVGPDTFEKGRKFIVQKSHLSHPKRLNRLLMAAFFAYYWIIRNVSTTLRHQSREIAVFAALGALSGVAVAQAEKLFHDVSKVPRDGPAAQDLVRRGWVIEEQIEGDLNGDTTPEVELELIEDLPGEPARISGDEERSA